MSPEVFLTIFAIWMVLIVVWSFYTDRIKPNQLNPDVWSDTLQKLNIINKLPAGKVKELVDLMIVFVRSKSWEGCGGYVITDETKCVISAYACLPLLNIEHDYYKSLKTILVYPAPYKRTEEEAPPDWVEAGRSERDTIILVWENIKGAAYDEAISNNLVIHEFSHQLDRANREGRGILADEEFLEKFYSGLNDEYQSLCDLRDRGEPTVVWEYGLSNIIEFFAVSTECYYLHTAELESKHPSLFNLMKDYYN